MCSTPRPAAAPPADGDARGGEPAHLSPTRGGTLPPRPDFFAYYAEGILASGGVDAQIIVWDLDNKVAKHKLPLAHQGGAIKQLVWAGNELVSGGMDGAIKTWTV